MFDFGRVPDHSSVSDYWMSVFEKMCELWVCLIPNDSRSFLILRSSAGFVDPTSFVSSPLFTLFVFGRGLSKLSGGFLADIVKDGLNIVIDNSSDRHQFVLDGLRKTSVLARIAMALDTTSEYLMEGVPQNYVDEIGYAKRLIARNVNQMSNAEKREILSILLGDEEG